MYMSLVSNSLLICTRKEGNVLFNDALNTFYLRLYGVRHMVKDHSDSENGNPLPPHRLLFPINSKYVCTYVCIYVCMCEIYVSVNIRTYVCVCVCVCVCVIIICV